MLTFPVSRLPCLHRALLYTEDLKTLLASTWRRWLGWSSRSANRRIFAASALVGALSLVVLLASVAKEIVVAREFGRSDAIDAFLIAFMLPAFAINLVAGSLNSSLVPAVVRVTERDGVDHGIRLFSSALTCTLVLLLAVSMLLAAIFPLVMPLLAANFTPEKRALTEALFYMLLPAITISGIAMAWSGMLNAGQRFAAAAAAPVLVPMLTIACLLLFAERLGVAALAAGTVAGMAGQCVLLAAALRRRGIPVLPRWHGMTAPMRQMIQQFAPMVVGALLMGSTALVDQAMAAMLDPGSVATLGYGGKVVSAMTGLGAMALGTAILPHFSEMIARNDDSGLRHSIATYNRGVLISSVVVTAALVLFSDAIVRTLFERGAFGADDTRIVTQVQVMYLLQIPFYLMGTIYVRVISALGRNAVLMWGAAISLPLNAVMNFVLMEHLGVAGIALSTSVVYLVSWIYLGWSVKRCLR